MIGRFLQTIPVFFEDGSGTSPVTQAAILGNNFNISIKHENDVTGEYLSGDLKVRRLSFSFSLSLSLLAIMRNDVVIIEKDG